MNKSLLLRQWHPTLVLLPGKSHGWRSLAGCSPWGREESDTTEWLHFHFSLSCIWRRKWQPTPVFLPRGIPGMREPGGLPTMGSHRVGHDWSDLAAAAATKYPVSQILWGSNKTWYSQGALEIQTIQIKIIITRNGKLIQSWYLWKYSVVSVTWLIKWLIFFNRFWLQTKDTNSLKVSTKQPISLQ